VRQRDYTVSFSEPVTGVDAGDFSIALSGGLTAIMTPAVSAVARAIRSWSTASTAAARSPQSRGQWQHSRRGRQSAPAGQRLAGLFSWRQFHVGATPQRSQWRTSTRRQGRSGHPQLQWHSQCAPGQRRWHLQVAHTYSVGAGRARCGDRRQWRRKPDLVTANSSGPSFGAAGQWRRHFPGRSELHYRLGPVTLAVADLNGDGKPDLVELLN